MKHFVSRGLLRVKLLLEAGVLNVSASTESDILYSLRDTYSFSGIKFLHVSSKKRCSARPIY